MIKWYVTAALQGVFSVLPASAEIDYQYQKLITGTTQPSPERLRELLREGFREAAAHLSHYRAQAGPGARPELTLEINAGNFPAAALGLALAGAARVRVFDNQHMVVPELFRAVLGMLRYYGTHPRDDSADSVYPAELRPDLQPERLAALHQVIDDTLARRSLPIPAEALSRLNIELVGDDPRRTGLDSGSADLIVSSSTLEHYRTPVLGAILEECRRVIAPDGVMSHFIDLGDHYARLDPAIGVYNFLRYTEARWNLFNNPLLFQNRLRISDYRALHAAAGFRIVTETIEGEDPLALARVPLARQFQAYPEADLLPVLVWQVSVPVEPGA